MNPFPSAADPSIWPRFLYFAAAPFAIIGLVLALRGTLAVADARLRRLGSSLFVSGTLAQMIAGIWFLATLSASQQDSVLWSPGGAAMFWGAVAAGGLALLAIHRYPGLAAVASLVALVGMASTWLREWMLSIQPDFSAESSALAPETALFMSIALLLSVGLCLTCWISWKLLEELIHKAPRTA